ncbi:Rho GTPase activation protein [Anaeromyces robustus]|uniref:Rho GTPase activation protein n=1 Tax=Anaeromyces robustus TaxID=1754192 RepID=A0A1Y1XQ85_9FUNG|nr:Rho GTPase activation protein [Anaeromyces robustus]|eukprot:ORX87484.1 Rho GTPase activation protein [Anaeromyces robustus]
MSTNSLNSQEENQETGRSSAWSAFSSRFQDFKQKTRNKHIELSNYAKTKGSELAVYANQQSRSIMSRIRKEEQPAQEEVKERYVFGLPLEYVMQYSGHEYGIPLIVYQCINELTYSIDEVGLYRIPGSTHQVDILRDKFDYLEPVDLSGENPNTIATLLKLFLRNLPNKLVDEEHNIQLNDIIRKYNIENPEDFTEYDEIAEVLEQLPEWDYNLLGYICFHLKSVSDNAELNKMTLNNLGLIFCPTLKISPAVFSVLVLHSQNVFRRFLSNEEDEYDQENEGSISSVNDENSEDYTNKQNNSNNYDNNNTNNINTGVNAKVDNNNNNAKTETNKFDDNNENFADFENNQDILKQNSNFNETDPNENTSETLIN